MTTQLPDRAVGNPSDDRLGREPFARGIAELIANGPAGSSLRIGIYGGWGEGKTSVLQILAHHLGASGHVCVWFVPWTMSTREEMAAALLSQIADALDVDVGNLATATTAAGLAKRLRGAAGANFWAGMVEAVAGEAIERRTAHAKRKLAEDAYSAVLNALGERKLVVLIDDLDRVRPELIPSLLLTLREVLDEPNFYYVLALAPEIIREGLGMVHSAWGGGAEFLEKIVELPKYLPETTADQRLDYFKGLLESVEGLIPSTILDDLAPLLPSNPRRLKLLARYIASLASIQERFLEREVDWYAFYLVQLLHIEYPEESRRLFGDSEAVKAMESAWLARLDKRRGTEEEEPNLPEDRYAPEGADERQRFLSLCEVIRSRGPIVRGHFGLKELYLLPDNPPRITYKDVDDVLEELLASEPDDVLPILEHRFGVDGAIQESMLRPLFETALTLRDDHIGGVVDLTMEGDVVAGLRVASLLTAILRSLAIDLKGFASGQLDADLWIKMFHQFERWSKFTTFDYHEAQRQEERTFLRDALQLLPLETRIAVYEARRPFADDLNELSEEFLSLKEEIADEINVSITDAILARFGRSDGLEVFWAADYRSNGKDMVFDPDSLFHSGEYREKLRQVATRAGEEVEVQQNFLTYFRMLVHGAFEPSSSFPAKGCRSLLEDGELIQIIWPASLKHPLNPRTAGSLFQARLRLFRLGVSEELLAVPDWWVRLDQLGFFPRELPSD